jgi:nucleoside 2-deoxyribosyltransferase
MSANGKMIYSKARFSMALPLLECTRVAGLRRLDSIDELAGPGIIFEDIKRPIAEAKIVVAEITAPNQNVFYELGYAHALNKPTILLAQRGKELPFDIRSYRVIFYDDSIGGKPALERNLQKHLEAILRES